MLNLRNIQVIEDSHNAVKKQSSLNRKAKIPTIKNAVGK